MSDSDAQGSGGTTDEILTSPVFSLVTYTDANLSFWHYYRGFGNGSAKVEVSTDGVLTGPPCPEQPGLPPIKVQCKALSMWCLA
jgi:hypothetical protein